MDLLGAQICKVLVNEWLAVLRAFLRFRRSFGDNWNKVFFLKHVADLAVKTDKFAVELPKSVFRQALIDRG